MIRIDRHIGITQIDTQLRLMIVGLVQGFGEQVAVDQVYTSALLVNPAKESLNP